MIGIAENQTPRRLFKPSNQEKLYYLRQRINQKIIVTKDIMSLLVDRQIGMLLNQERY